MRESDRVRPGLTRGYRLVLLALFGSALLLGCAPYELRDVLDGPQGKALSISPSETVVPAGNTTGFTASGGVGPYVYAVFSGGGILNTTTGVYTAPAGAGTTVIRVTDRTGKSVDATVTVQVGSIPYVDYVVPLVVVTTSPTARMPNEPVSGTFEYRNSGTLAGTASLSWKVYASTDGAVDAGDLLVASGTGLPALAASTTSGSIGWNGRWPLTFGDYFILAQVSTAEDANSTNDVGSSALQTNVGVYDETTMEPDNDFNNFVDVAKLGITLIPGMTLKITGSMKDTDMDDIFQFDTGTATRVLVTVVWSVFDKNVEIFFLDKNPSGGYIDLGSMAGQNGIMSFGWPVDVPAATRWLNLDNYWNGTDYSGGPGVVPITYTCVITAQ